MALTSEQFLDLVTHWPLVIQTVHPGIDQIPDGGGDSIASKLSTWRGEFSKPTEAQVEDALLNTVIPNIAQQEVAEQQRQQKLVDLRSGISADLDPTDYSGENALIQALAERIAWLEQEVINLGGGGDDR